MDNIHCKKYQIKNLVLSLFVSACFLTSETKKNIKKCDSGICRFDNNFNFATNGLTSEPRRSKKQMWNLFFSKVNIVKTYNKCCC